jgi:hypothetical protein
MWRVATQHKVKGQIKNVASGGIVRLCPRPRTFRRLSPSRDFSFLSQVENVASPACVSRFSTSPVSPKWQGGQRPYWRTQWGCCRLPTGRRRYKACFDHREHGACYLPRMGSLKFARAILVSSTLWSGLLQVLPPGRSSSTLVKFKGADLKNNTQVVCAVWLSAMPRSKAAKSAVYA